MYIGQIAASLRSNAFAAAQQNSGQSDQVVKLLNDKAADTSPLEKAQKRMCQLKDDLLAHDDPDIEGALKGYLERSHRYQASQKELGYRLGMLGQFESLTSQYASASQALDDARESCRSAMDAGDLDGAAKAQDHVSELSKDLAQADLKLNDLVALANEMEAAGVSGIISYADMLQKGGDGQKGTFTRENFAQVMGDKAEALKGLLEENQRSLDEYCKRVGITGLEFEQYLEGKQMLNAALLSAKSDLFHLLRESGEDDGITFSQLV